MKLAIASALIWVAAVGVGNCGDEVATAAKNWANDAEELAHSAKGRGWKIADDLPPQPASADELADLSSTGFSAGQQVDNSVTVLDQSFRKTGLFSESELENIREGLKEAACYIYSWHLENGALPQNAEDALSGYIESQIFTRPFTEPIEGAIQSFGEAITNADSSDEAAVNVAIVIACL